MALRKVGLPDHGVAGLMKNPVMSSCYGQVLWLQRPRLMDPGMAGIQSPATTKIKTLCFMLECDGDMTGEN
jgi:hypothetical protein